MIKQQTIIKALENNIDGALIDPEKDEYIFSETEFDNAVMSFVESIQTDKDNPHVEISRTYTMTETHVMCVVSYVSAAIMRQMQLAQTGQQSPGLKLM